MGLGEEARRNREAWDRVATDYQASHGAHIGSEDPRWGLWQLPEQELRILGDVAGSDVLELGCGAAQWAVRLAARGARVVALDNSGAQLEHARRAVARAGVHVELVHAAAEQLPFEGERFDVVFCDWGATTFVDPYVLVPEVARVLRPGGRFAFSGDTPLSWMCLDAESDEMVDRLERPYFGLRRWTTPEGTVEFLLGHGDYIRLFVANGLEVLDLREIRPPEGAASTYRSEADTAWARRWPMEQIWVLRKETR